MGKTVWIVAMSPDGVHSSRNFRLQKYAPPGGVAMVPYVLDFKVKTLKNLYKFQDMFNDLTFGF